MTRVKVGTKGPSVQTENRPGGVNVSISGLWNDRGLYDASTNLFPSSGGSGTGGAIQRYNTYLLSVGGTLDGVYYGTGAILIAMVNDPGQVATNWRII